MMAQMTLRLLAMTPLIWCWSPLLKAGSFSHHSGLGSIGPYVAHLLMFPQPFDSRRS